MNRSKNKLVWSNLWSNSRKCLDGISIGAVIKLINGMLNKVLQVLSRNSFTCSNDSWAECLNITELCTLDFAFQDSPKLLNRIQFRWIRKKVYWDIFSFDNDWVYHACYVNWSIVYNNMEFSHFRKFVYNIHSIVDNLNIMTRGNPLRNRDSIIRCFPFCSTNNFSFFFLCLQTNLVWQVFGIDNNVHSVILW